MPTMTLDLLTEAWNQALIIKFWNKYDVGSTEGYVLDIGPKFFLLGYISEDLRFDGFQCVRISDFRRPQVPHPYAEFFVEALRKRKQSIKQKPKIDLSSISTLLLSADRAFPLVTIHREEKKPDVCEIGKVVEIDGGWVSFLEIGPDALWETKPTRIRLDDITRVEFGGGYEEALYLVGGKPKSLKQKRSSKT
jgi:hypothetical protein